MVMYWERLKQHPCKSNVIIVKMCCNNAQKAPHTSNTFTHKQLYEDAHLRLHTLLFDLIKTLHLISAFQVFIKGQLVKDS